MSRKFAYKISLNENDSHSDTLAGARVSGAAGRVKTFIFYLLLTFTPIFDKIGDMEISS